MEYKVKKEDLIGVIKGFPIEIVQRMVEMQVEQGNKADVTVFQKARATTKKYGGASWDKTAEGLGFWNAVIGEKNFKLFFEKYPKRETLESEEPKEGVNIHVYYRGVTGRGREIIDILKNIGGIENHIYGCDTNSYYFINPKTKVIDASRIGKDYSYLLEECYTEKFLPEEIETIEINGKKYKKNEVLNCISKLKEIK